MRTSRRYSTQLELERAALVGSSMGAATAMAFALEHPERVPALVQITPAYTGYARTGDVDGELLGAARRRARQGGIDEFVEVAQPGGSPSAGATWRARPPASAWSATSIWTPWRRRCARCRSSIAWKGLERCRALEVPVLIVGSHDEADTGCTPSAWPRSTAESSRRRAGGRGRGESPLAWQGARLSNVIADFLERVGYPLS